MRTGVRCPSKGCGRDVGDAADRRRSPHSMRLTRTYISFEPQKSVTFAKRPKAMPKSVAHISADQRVSNAGALRLEHLNRRWRRRHHRFFQAFEVVTKDSRIHRVITPAHVISLMKA
jgi:hypothetical protein